MKSKSAKPIVPPPKPAREMEFSELIAEKLALEVEKLRLDLTPSRVGFWERLRKYLEKNVGQILIIVALLSSALGPAWHYLLNERNRRLAELVQVDANSLLSLEKELSPDVITRLSVQDPYLMAPFLLNQLSYKPEVAKNVETLYVRMYEVNAYAIQYNWFDDLLFSALPDNKKILEDELVASATRAFSHMSPANKDENGILTAYFHIIHNLQLEEKEKFQPLVASIEAHCCKDREYDDFCSIIRKVLKPCQ